MILDLNSTFTFNGTEHPVWDDENHTLYWIPGHSQGPFYEEVDLGNGLTQEGAKYYNNTYKHKNRTIFRDLDDIEGFSGFNGSHVRGLFNFGPIFDYHL